MNVLYLHSHDTGRAIQPYGYAVKTPNLQHLAETGMLFRNAHCAAPTCSPSRAALLTGCYAHEVGMVALAHRGGKLLFPERHLANYLAQNGYETVIAGMHHVGPREACGYTHIANLDLKIGEDVVSYACDFLKNRDTSKPFFLDVGFLETHRTEWVCKGFNQAHHTPHDGDGIADHVQVPAPLPDSPETRRDWLDYVHSVERLDRYYGMVLAALDAAGLAEDTIILATTDHGIAFPLHKCNLTAHGTGVLFILKAPTAFHGGKTSDALVSHIDYFPTLCDLLGLEKPDWLRGSSLCPLADGTQDKIHEEIFAEVTFHASFEPKRGVRSQRWNYIRNFAAPHPTILPNCDDSHSKRKLMANGWAKRMVPVEELYDLVYDAMERTNLASAPENEDVLNNMRQLLDDWMARTNDPLLNPDASVLPLPQKANPWDHEHADMPSSEWDTSEWKLIQNNHQK